MPYDSYIMRSTLSNLSSDAKTPFMKTKQQQVRYLFNLALDREDGCLLNGIKFSENPRVFNRQIKTNYYQTLTLETIKEVDRFKSGDILKYDNDYWICTSSFVFHGLYCKGIFIRTNYTLKWQNDNKDTIERRCYVISASQYNSGEDGNKTMILGYNQFMVVLPCDKETLILDRTKRFFIDKNTVSPIVYRTTRNDSVPYSNWERGCVCLVVTEDQYNPKIDSIENWLCNYIPSPTPTPQSFNITYLGECSIRSGGISKTFTATSDKTVVWSNVLLPIQEGKIIITDIGSNKCKVKCLLDENLVGTTFKLTATDTDNNESYITVSITGGV